MQLYLFKILGHEKLPWSLNMQGFGAYSLQGIGHPVKLQILKPVNTTATLAITPKYQGPHLTQVGIAIHIDMSPLDFSGSRSQVNSHVALLENLIALYYAFCQDGLKDDINQSTNNVSSNLHPTVDEVSSYTPPTPADDLAHPHSTSARQARPSESEQTTMQLTEFDDQDEQNKVQVVTESQCNQKGQVIVTAWVQWTVARVSASIYANDKHSERKLTAELEDLAVSVDLHQVYSKFKCQVDRLSVLHFTKKDGVWVAGEHKGVVMTDGDQITRNMQIMNHTSSEAVTAQTDNQTSTGSMTAPHSDQPKPHQGFLSITVTIALCKNVHSKWNQLIKKHLQEDRSVSEATKDQYLSEVDLR